MPKKEEKIAKFLEEYGTLYVVTNYISNDTAGTNLWNIYPDLEHAMRWIRLVEDYWKSEGRFYREISRKQIGDMIKELEFEYYHLGGKYTQRFVLDIYYNE